MADLLQCFFAYPSNPPWLSEVIENAITQINNSGSGLVVAQSWKSLIVTGKLIIHEVCETINKCDLFVCDLTTINSNVLFELGYAISRNKRVWITLDPSFEEAKTNYDKLRLLTTVGYAPYQNAYQLANLFFQEEPFKDLESTIYRSVIQSIVQSQSRPPALLYLKSEVDTEASVRLSRHLAKSKMPLVLDDPQEINSQPLAWYAQNTCYASAVLAHLLDENRGSKLFQNAKYSFVCGMAFGFGKPLLMLAHAPYRPPLDYRDLLQVHETAASCIRAVDARLPAIEQEYLVQQEKYRNRIAEIEHGDALRRVSLGEDMAENEQQSLLDYFIPTAAYFEALKAPQSMIYVGRKGSGKTANLYMIADKLQKDTRNHVCMIKPVSYELEGVLTLLRSSIPKAEQGYLIESLWKFLVYTELALSVYEKLTLKPVHYVRTPEENELVEYVDRHSELIRPEFTVRMEHAIRDLCQIDASQSVASQRARVSEILHSDLLGDLREVLGRVLEKKSRVCVLVDNLDKAWIRGGDLVLLSDFLFGLLSVSRVISEDFQKRGATWRQVNLSLLVFLRSDIFSHIMAEARERDKLIFSRLDWNDTSLLQRIIEGRFFSSLEKRNSPEEIWQMLFAPTVKGTSTKDYLVSHIIPRPRDIIYLCKAALANAVNHQHTKIEENDILQAERGYSQYAFNSLEAETSAQLDHCEELLYEFAGADEIVKWTLLSRHCVTSRTGWRCRAGINGGPLM